MNGEDYKSLKARSKISSNDFIALGIILILLGFSLTSLYLSMTYDGWIWFFAQIFFGVFILQWFFLIHDLGHGHFFQYKKLNVFFGHLGSAFVLLPFFPWRYIHRKHHVWTGWKDKDPAMTIIIPHKIPQWKKNVINICWKYWIPIFSLSFSFSNFWNVKKLNSLFPDKKIQNIFSILYVPVVHGLLIYFLGWNTYLSVWGLAYAIFLILSDPLLLSQHSGIAHYHSKGESVGQIPFHEQDVFTRSLIFPKWASICIFLGFNGHALHHLFPTLPGYRLIFINHSSPNDIHWIDWLKKAKKTPGFDLLLSEELNIKNKI